MRYITTILLFLLLSGSSLLAQSGGYAGEFTRMGFSPRGIAMGNAMSAVTTTGSYAYYNPALAARPNETIQVDISTAALQFNRQLHMAGVNIQLPPMAGLSLALLNARVTGIDGRTTSGYHTEMLSTAEYQLIGNFAIRFSDTIWAGIGFKYNLANYHSEIPASSGLGLDAGLLIKITPELNAAFTIKDMLASYDIDTADLYGTEQSVNRNMDFPVRIISGLSFRILENWMISTDFELRTASALTLREEISDQNGFQVPVARRDEIKQRSTFIRTGTQYLLHDRITIRTGLELIDLASDKRLQPSIGFSIHLPFDQFTPSIDYAFKREPNQVSSMHIFALRLNI